MHDAFGAFVKIGCFGVPTGVEGVATGLGGCAGAGLLFLALRSGAGRGKKKGAEKDGFGS